MGSAQDAAAIRAGYQAFASGDLAAVGELLSPDIRWHMPGNSPLAGTYDGLPDVVQYLTTLMQMTGGTYGVDVQDVLASDDHVVALVREHGQREGATLDAPEAHVWRMRDGRAAEFWAYRADSDAVDAFWS